MPAALGPTRRLLVEGAFAALASLPLAIPARARDSRFFRIATGPVGSSTFALGTLLAEAVSRPPGSPPCELGGPCGVPGLVALAQSSAGSLANLELLGSGRVESALVLADHARNAQLGVFENALPALRGRLRAIAVLLPAALHLVVRADLPIDDLAGLLGRRLGLEEAGAGTLGLARLLFEARDLDDEGFEFAFVPRAAAVDGIAEGRLDALLLVGPWPVPAVEELVASGRGRLLPLSGEWSERLLARHSWLVRQEIPAETYSGQPAIETLGVPLVWIVVEDLDEELAYGLTAALWRRESLARLRTGFAGGETLGPERALEGLSVPLHPGAERWYREQGLFRDP
ncbi:MAG: TAXI family TRAP transporter solute-binding subunit [Geminicoccaceae bacterium]|nr:TAXI family TRAP transporter solute-binding subunit [Geminicoccaceae bacterium]MDW8125727.1 TAXI family TRAP transporter solute-binding subunit [Geminicoccaceae bacterium]